TPNQPVNGGSIKAQLGLQNCIHALSPFESSVIGQRHPRSVVEHRNVGGLLPGADVPALLGGGLRIGGDPPVASANTVPAEHRAVGDLPVATLRELAPVPSVMQCHTAAATAALTRPLATFHDDAPALPFIHGRADPPG